MKGYDLEKARELWRQEPDDERVFRAAMNDIDEYPPDIQVIIRQEAAYRRQVQSEDEAIPKKTPLQIAFSSIGLDYDTEETKDLQKADELIRLAFTVAVFSVCVTLVLGVLAILGYPLFGVSVWVLLDVVIVITLAYGVRGRSRACAVILFVYWTVGKIFQSVNTESIMPCCYGILFGFFFFQGIRGTFAHSKMTKLMIMSNNKETGVSDPDTESK